jgi:vacuolar-type H+-ATPase subunit C/Vma6
MSKDNNPSPLEDKLTVLEMFEEITDGWSGTPMYELTKQTLTNYANMVEMLEGLVEKYKKVINKELSILPGSIDHAQQIVLKEFVIADITKVLEGEK